MKKSPNLVKNQEKKLNKKSIYKKLFNQIKKTEEENQKIINKTINRKIVNEKSLNLIDC